MEINATYIAGLIYKSMSDTLSESEQADLHQWLQASPANRALYEDTTRRQEMPRFFLEQAPEALAELRNDLLNRIQSGIGQTGKLADINTSGSYPKSSNRTVYRRIFFRYAAAAVLIIALLAVFLSRKSEPTGIHDPEPPIAEHHDVAPGGNKAYLRLADGTLITLDSAGSGHIAKQGNANVLKTAEGEIVYQANGPAATETMMNTMSTPRGGQYRLTLPDGTKVWLNAASSIRYPAVFTGGERNVSITGEVYFEVKKRNSRPFIVSTPRGKTVVLGTHFNINAYDNEPYEKTTLIEGRIRVERTAEGKPAETVTLRPGQQARLASKLEVANNVNTDQVLAWKNGFFSLEDATLEQVMKQLERWYDIEVIYEGIMPAVEFKGKMNRGVPLSAVLKWFAQLGIKSDLNGKTLILKQINSH